MPKTVAGLLPVLHTPFLADGAIDYASLDRQMDFVYQHGADGVTIALASDLLRLTFAERLELGQEVAKRNRGRGSLILSVGAESIPQALTYARAAEAAGADALMAIPPLSARLGEAGLGQYFGAIAEATNIPLIVQDASGYVGQSMSIAFQASLLDKYGRDKLYFKPEASPIGTNLSRLRDATRGQARIFEGSGGICLVDSYRRGITGTIPGSDMMDGVGALWRALKAGDDARIYQLYFPLCGIVALQLQAGLDGFLSLERYILHKRGIIASPRMREPASWTPDPETLAEVDRLLLLLEAAVAG
jgi:2-keto-3-deoxy-L-arabinonate dehydratase